LLSLWLAVLHNLWMLPKVWKWSISLPLVAITISVSCERILLICYFLMICTVVVTKEKEFFEFLCVLFLVAVRVLFDELGGIRRSCRFLFVCEDCVRFLWVCAVVKVHGLC
jgi:hypothetical protein